MWKKPVLEELDVSLTANGLFDTTIESQWLGLFNDSKKEPEKESTPTS